MRNSEVAATWSWLIVALIFYGAMLHLTWLALKPKPQPTNPDWFWGGDLSEGHWVRYDEDAALTHAEYVGTKPEQTDRQGSKPTSEAG